MNIKRYKALPCNSAPSGIMIVPAKDGEFVKFEDAKKLVDDAMQTVAVTGQLLDRAISRQAKPLDHEGG